MINSEHWYDHNVINSHCQLLVHRFHDETIQFVIHNGHGKTAPEEIRYLPPKVSRVFSILHDIDHFVVVEIHPKEKYVVIWDGLENSTLDKWHNQVRQILVRCHLLSLVVEDSFVRTDGELGEGKEMFLPVRVGDKEEKWTLELLGDFFPQKDTFNCGPIAILKMMSVFNTTLEDVTSYQKKGKAITQKLRRAVHEDFIARVRENSNTLKVTVEKKEENAIGLENGTQASPSKLTLTRVTRGSSSAMCYATNLKGCSCTRGCHQRCGCRKRGHCCHSDCTCIGCVNQDGN